MPISRICISTRWWLVGQPLGSLGRVVPVPGRLRERAVGVQQERGIVGDAVSPSGVPGPDRSHRLRGDRASGVLLQPFGAKQRRTHGPGPMTAGLLDSRRCGRGSRARLPGPAAAQLHRISVETGFCGLLFSGAGRGSRGQQLVLARVGVLVYPDTASALALGPRQYCAVGMVGPGLPRRGLGGRLSWTSRIQPPAG